MSGLDAAGTWQGVDRDLHLILEEVKFRTAPADGPADAKPGAWRRSWALPGGRTAVSTVAYRPPARTAAWRVEGDLSAPEASGIARRAGWVLNLDLDAAAIAGPLLADPAIAPLVRAHPRYARPRDASVLEGLFATILGQQVSVAAAHAQRRRVLAYLATGADEPVPRLEHLAAVEPEALAASCGLTRAKARALCGLARSPLAPVLELPPWEIPEPSGGWQRALTALTGVGDWSATWVRLVSLGDLTAAAPGDLGVQEAVQWLEGWADRPDADRVAERMKRWQPVAGLGMVHALRGLRAARRLSGARRPADLPRPDEVARADAAPAPA